MFLFGRIKQKNKKGVFQMKNTKTNSVKWLSRLAPQFRMICAIVLAGLIGFSMVSCGDKNSTTTEEENPTATFAEIEFFPSSWGKEGEYRAEQWETNNQIKLSSFFSLYKPKQGDVLSFKISGVSDKDLKYIKLELGECQGGDWNTYEYLGSSWTGSNDKLIDLHSSFTDIVIDVPISSPTNSNASIYAQLVNLLWQKNPQGEYNFNSRETLPADYKKGDVMATVNNFTISLVKIDKTQNIDKNLWYAWSLSSTATFNYSVANDGVCTVTIGGTPDVEAWRISADYYYTGIAGKQYEYKFEAWTQSGDRDMYVSYHEDNDDKVYLGETVKITTTRTPYTIKGQSLPKSGDIVRFQLANQLGTVNIKMLEIKEVK
jgi:hypothetical protein